VRRNGDGLFFYEREEFNSTGLDDGLSVDGDLRPAAAVLGEHNPLAAQQPDTTSAKAGESCAPGGPVLHDRGAPDLPKGLIDDGG